MPAKTVAEHYGIDGEKLERQYKEHLSGYREWDQLRHAEEWLLFPENIGEWLSIDETSPSQGELYTIVSNKAAHNGKGTIVAIVRGTRSEDVIEILEKIPERVRDKVTEVTLDMANSMRKIARACFRNAKVVIDRFHVQKLALEAVQECAGRPSRRTTNCRRRQRQTARGTSLRPWTTVTRGASCSSAAGTCCTSRRTTGPPPRKNVPKPSSRNTPQSNRPTSSPTPYARFSTASPQKTPPV